MKYPCTNCLVEVVCNEPCEKMIFFLDSLTGGIGKYVPDEWISSERKLARFLKCRKFFPNTSVFNKILSAYEKFHKRKIERLIRFRDDETEVYLEYKQDW